MDRYAQHRPLVHCVRIAGAVKGRQLAGDHEGYALDRSDHALIFITEKTLIFNPKTRFLLGASANFPATHLFAFMYNYS